MASYLRGLARGIGPDLLGGPVDLSRDLINAGLGAAEFVGQKTGLRQAPLPRVQPGAVGDSDWWANLTNVSDDNTPQYTAGRLTPLGVSAAGLASQGAKRLVNAMVSRPAPSRSGAPPTLTSQEGAIRLNGRPDLMLSHDTTIHKLHNAQGSSGVIELYAPSIGITKNRIMSEFSSGEPGSITLIPRVGAFDPATSPSTLFNRDAYTARWRDFKGKPAGKAGEMTEQPLHQALQMDSGQLLEAFSKGTGPRLQDLRVSYGSGSGDWLAASEKRSLKLIQNAGWDKVSQQLRLVEQEGAADTSDVGRAVNWFLLESPYLRVLRAPDPKAEARDRLVERLAGQGKDVAGRENVKSNFKKLWDGDVTGDLSRDVAIRRSPAFRSFAEYERSPMGADLLVDAPNYPYTLRNSELRRQAEEALLRQRGGTGLPLERREVSSVLAEFVRRGQSQEGFLNDPKQMGTAMRDILQEEWTGGLSKRLGTGFGRLSPDGERAMVRALQSVPEFQKQAGNLLRAYAKAPSSYAELKVSGPVPLTAENWAGAILRSPSEESYEMDRVLKSLEHNGITVFKARGPKTDFKTADILQKQAGPARKKRMFER